MSFDLSQFNDLDMENIGGWPTQVKAVFAGLLAILVFVGGYYLFVSDAIDIYQSEQVKEQQLRDDFKQKYLLAANLKLYREQLVQMEAQFAELLKMLPSENEMPGLLDDLTYVATDAGLKIQSLDWDAEIQRDFYIEFPIRMAVTGDYHQLGTWSAELPSCHGSSACMTLWLSAIHPAPWQWKFWPRPTDLKRERNYRRRRLRGKVNETTHPPDRGGVNAWRLYR